MYKVQRVLCCVGMYPINVSFLYFNVTVDFNDSPLMAMCCYYRAFSGVLSWSHCLLNVCWPILETCVCTPSQSSWMSPTPDPQWVPVMLSLHSCLHCRPPPTGVGPGSLPPVQPGLYIQMIQRSSNAKYMISHSLRRSSTCEPLACPGEQAGLCWPWGFCDTNWPPVWRLVDCGLSGGRALGACYIFLLCWWDQAVIWSC